MDWGWGGYYVNVGILAVTNTPLWWEILIMGKDSACVGSENIWKTLPLMLNVVVNLKLLLKNKIHLRKTHDIKITEQKLFLFFRERDLL